MRLLADSCLHGDIVRALRDAGHDVDAVSEWPADPGDTAILQAAAASARVVVTADKDFGELVIRALVDNRGVIYVSQEVSVARQIAQTLLALRDHANEISLGTLVIVEGSRIRISRSRN